MNKYPAIFLTIVISGCANPINKVTSENYAKDCADAESAGRLDVAEEACYRAVVNVEWGNLGDELKSERLYNLARIKRRLGKLDEAEKYFVETIQIENGITPKRNEQLGRRLAELSAVYYEQKQFSKASPYLEQILPLAHLYSGKEKQFIAGLFHFYSIELGNTTLSKELKASSIELGFNETGK
jgi:tetratricopeptide (TPR) repeat protein